MRNSQENSDDADDPIPPWLPDATGDGAVADPFPALIITLDVRSFSSLTNPQAFAVRRQLYDLVISAFRAGGVDWDVCEHEDRGDGILIVVPPGIPKPRVLGPVLTELLRGVREADAGVPGWTWGLRVCAHAGEVHRDANGFVGSDVNLAFRLLDAPVLKAALGNGAGRAAVVVSEQLHESTVRHRYPGMADRTFRRVAVSVKETDVHAWLHVPGGEAQQGTTSPRPEPALTGPETTAGHSIIAGRDITATDGIIAGGNVDIDSAPRRTRWRGRKETR
ncbi:hypothetical protein L6E12_10800 [Actinokineospora sp. PR83]|uniref:hypothetical protein n=1 Tax=Actinokineospora sp. PR83 TaxID=2884908 RepID=UPI001F33794D|nr:hypothetical protein [Actinokineospora sp. PR83]MCG8916278.1 hypothetical protein [Actinokineospora sp. PR83]